MKLVNEKWVCTNVLALGTRPILYPNSTSKAINGSISKISAAFLRPQFLKKITLYIKACIETCIVETYFLTFWIRRGEVFHKLYVEKTIEV